MATQMRERILNVASDLFTSQGINATSVDTIVDKAGIAKVTLYKYFKSKEQLILEYLREYDGKLWARLSAVTARKEDSPRNRLSALVDAALDWIAEPEFKGFAFINASVEFPQEENLVHQTSLAFAGTLRNAMTEIAREAGIKQAESLAMQLSLIIEGTAIAERTQRNAGAIDNAKEMAKVLIQTAK